MNTMDGTSVQLAQPYFMIVEAKREQNQDTDKSKAQFLAQVKTLSIQYPPF